MLNIQEGVGGRWGSPGKFEWNVGNAISCNLDLKTTMTQ